MAGAFSVDGFNEQIFGADKQVPGRVQSYKEATRLTADRRDQQL